MSKISLLFFLITFSYCSDAQSLRELFQQGQQAKADSNYAAFLDLTQQAISLHPSHPALLHNLALGYALTDKNDNAISTIRRSISYNANYPFKEEPHFNHLKKWDGYDQLQIFADSLKQKISSSEVYSKTVLDKIHPEDFAIINNEVFLADVNGGKLIKINSQGVAVTLADLLSSVMAIVPDENHRLWVTTSMMPQYKAYDSTQLNATKIYHYDIMEKKVVKEIKLEGEHVLGAGCTDINGNIYFTDSTTPKIYYFNKAKGDIEEFMELKSAFNLQGITYDESNHTLFVADYIKGIVKVDLNTRSEKWLRSDGFLLKGIDGLVKVDKGLVAIQNGSSPRRLLYLETNGEDIVLAKIIDNNLGYEAEPTNGKYINGVFYYIANSPWPLYDKNSKAIYSKWSPLEIRAWNVSQ